MKNSNWLFYLFEFSMLAICQLATFKLAQKGNYPEAILGILGSVGIMLIIASGYLNDKTQELYTFIVDNEFRKYEERQMRRKLNEYRETIKEERAQFIQ